MRPATLSHLGRRKARRNFRETQTNTAQPDRRRHAKGRRTPESSGRHPEGSATHPGKVDTHFHARRLWSESKKARHTLARRKALKGIQKALDATRKRDQEVRPGRRKPGNLLRLSGEENRERNRGQLRDKKEAATPQAAKGTQAGQRQQQSDPERRAQPGRNPYSVSNTFPKIEKHILEGGNFATSKV